MKKLLLLIFIISLCLSGCIRAGQPSPHELVKELARGKSGYIYTDAAKRASRQYISPQELSYLYYGNNNALPEADRTESFCIFISCDPSPTEIHIFKAKYQSDTDELAAMLQSRGKLLASPVINPNTGELFCKSPIDYRLFCKGRYVALVAGEECDMLKERLLEQL